MLFDAKLISGNEPLRLSHLPNAVKCRKIKKSVKFSEDSPGKSLMPPTFFGCHLRQKIDQKRRLSGRLSRIHFCDLIHGGGLVFGLHAIVASPAGRDQSRDDASRGRKHFNPRVPCGTRRKNCPCRSLGVDFYPRVPCGTRLEQILLGYLHQMQFLPTRPLRDATQG